MCTCLQCRAAESGTAGVCRHRACAEPHSFNLDGALCSTRCFVQPGLPVCLRLLHAGLGPRPPARDRPGNRCGSVRTEAFSEGSATACRAVVSVARVLPRSKARDCRSAGRGAITSFTVSNSLPLFLHRWQLCRALSTGIK